jgi:hypothetical protein
LQIHELPEYSGEPATNDVFPIDTGTHTFKLPFTSLGEAIITTVSATISGVAQTVKAAIEALATRVGALETKTTALETWETVNITLTPGANCSSVTLQNAYKIGKLLFIKFAVSPNSGLSSGANVDITVANMPTAKIVDDYRIGIGVIGVVLYSCWFINTTTIRCRRMAGDAWTSNGVIFTGIIPLA